MNSPTTPTYTRLYIFATIAMVGGVIQCAAAVALIIFLLAQDGPPILLFIAVILLAGGFVGVLSSMLIYGLRDIARGDVVLEHFPTNNTTNLKPN